jgi:hypothetical protein
MIIIALSVLALIIAVILAAGDSRPRVTTIVRETECKDENGGDR